MGGRGSSSGMRSSSSMANSSGRINIPDNKRGEMGAHSYVEGTAYFGKNTSASELLDFVDNEPYKSFGDKKVLSFDVVGGYSPRGNVASAHATVRELSDGTFDLDYPKPSGATSNKTFKSEASAMKSGRTALRNYVKYQYKVGG